MIYPRLLLARDFLTPDGAIFISIDHVTSIFGDPTTYSPKTEDTTPQNGRLTSIFGDTRFARRKRKIRFLLNGIIALVMPHQQPKRHSKMRSASHGAPLCGLPSTHR